MKRVITILICTFLLSSVAVVTVRALQDMDVHVFVDPRYQAEYAPRFFELGGPKEKYVPNRHLKIGIVIRNRTEMTIPFIIRVIFGTAPFDRYQEFFVFANAEEVMREVRLKNQFITTYDSHARRIGGGFDWSTMRVRAGLVILDVNDYEFRRSGTLGYAYNKTAVTQRTTILHELGHVLGNLGDEYSIGEREKNEEMDSLLKSLGKEYEYRLGRNWNRVRANLEYRTRNPFKWFPLIKNGFLPDLPPNRVELEEGHDIGTFVVPDEKCVMNHPEKSEGRFCAVCQLQLVDKICQYTGADVPWLDYY